MTSWRGAGLAAVQTACETVRFVQKTNTKHCHFLKAIVLSRNAIVALLALVRIEHD